MTSNIGTIDLYARKPMKIKLDKGAYMPERGHEADAGLDLKTPIDVIVPARGSVSIDTGVHIELPENTGGILFSKSGLNTKYNITSTGLVDVGYTGSIVVKLYNHGDNDIHLFEGDKITQLVIVPVVFPGGLVLVDELSETERGDKGFGSTGR